MAGIASKAAGGLKGISGAQAGMKLSGAFGAQVTSAIGGIPVVGGLANSLMRSDPDTPYNYVLSIDGIRSVHFKEVSGLKCTTEVTPVREGGLNMHERFLIKGMKFEPLKIKRGWFGANSDFYAWMRQVHEPAAFKRTHIGLHVLNDNAVDVGSFEIYNAFPVSFTAPSFDSMSKGTIAFEEIEIRYEYFEFEAGDAVAGAAQSGAAGAVNAAAGIF